MLNIPRDKIVTKIGRCYIIIPPHPVLLLFYPEMTLYLFDIPLGIPWMSLGCESIFFITLYLKNKVNQYKLTIQTFCKFIKLCYFFIHSCSIPKNLLLATIEPCHNKSYKITGPSFPPKFWLSFWVDKKGTKNWHFVTILSTLCLLRLQSSQDPTVISLSIVY